MSDITHLDDRRHTTPHAPPGPSNEQIDTALARLRTYDDNADRVVLRAVRDVAPRVVYATICRLLASYRQHPSA